MSKTDEVDDKSSLTIAGVVLSINIAPEKGRRKRRVGEAVVEEEHGLVGDAHAGNWHRQVSLLAQESIDKMVEMGLEVGPGDFAENLTTAGLNLLELPIGSRLRIGERVLLEVTQIGKECHTRCAIYYQAGDCVMPKEGIFALVLQGGTIKAGDEIEVLESGDRKPETGDWKPETGNRRLETGDWKPETGDWKPENGDRKPEETREQKSEKGITTGSRLETRRAMRIAILIVSDKGSRGERVDTAGPAIREVMEGHGAEVTFYEIIPDERSLIEERLKGLADQDRADVVFTAGGTGFSPRDVTPEATLAVVEKLAPGIPEAIRAGSLKITPHAMLSRAVAGIRGRTLIINMPGSEKAVCESLGIILPALPHAIGLLAGRDSECGRT